jgi:hypothetical protein
VIFIAFVSLPFLANSGPKELQTTYVNDIKISAEGDPIIAVKNLQNLHIEGKRLDELEDSHNALNEIFVIMGRSTSRVGGGMHILLAGVTDKTGITIEGKNIWIEGTDKRDFWNAVWVFNSIISNTEIDASVDLYDVQNILSGKEAVYLVQDHDNTCPQYGHVISAEGDIQSSLGYKQGEFGFDLFHYYETGGECRPAANETVSVDCPSPSEKTFVLTMRKGESNVITIEENSIDFQYSSCATVDEISVILRDLLYPNIISVLSKINIPMEL